MIPVEARIGTGAILRLINHKSAHGIACFRVTYGERVYEFGWDGVECPAHTNCDLVRLHQENLHLYMEAKEWLRRHWGPENVAAVAGVW